MKKLLEVLGILALTLAGLIGLVAIYGAYMEIAVPVTMAGNGRAYVGSWDQGYVSAHSPPRPRRSPRPQQSRKHPAETLNGPLASFFLAL